MMEMSAAQASAPTIWQPPAPKSKSKIKQEPQEEQSLAHEPIAFVKSTPYIRPSSKVNSRTTSRNNSRPASREAPEAELPPMQESNTTQRGEGPPRLQEHQRLVANKEHEEFMQSRFLKMHQQSQAPPRKMFASHTPPEHNLPPSMMEQQQEVYAMIQSRPFQNVNVNNRSAHSEVNILPRMQKLKSEEQSFVRKTSSAPVSRPASEVPSRSRSPSPYDMVHDDIQAAARRREKEQAKVKLLPGVPDTKEDPNWMPSLFNKKSARPKQLEPTGGFAKMSITDSINFSQIPRLPFQDVQIVQLTQAEKDAIFKPITLETVIRAFNHNKVKPKKLFVPPHSNIAKVPLGIRETSAGARLRHLAWIEFPEEADLFSRMEVRLRKELKNQRKVTGDKLKLSDEEVFQLVIDQAGYMPRQIGEPEHLYWELMWGEPTTSFRRLSAVQQTHPQSQEPDTVDDDQLNSEEYKNTKPKKLLSNAYSSDDNPSTNSPPNEEIAERLPALPYKRSNSNGSMEGYERDQMYDYFESYRSSFIDATDGPSPSDELTGIHSDASDESYQEIKQTHKLPPPPPEASQIDSIEPELYFEDPQVVLPAIQPMSPMIPPSEPSPAPPTKQLSAVIPKVIDTEVLLSSSEEAPQSAVEQFVQRRTDSISKRTLLIRLYLPSRILTMSMASTMTIGRMVASLEKRSLLPPSSSGSGWGVRELRDEVLQDTVYQGENRLGLITADDCELVMFEL